MSQAGVYVFSDGETAAYVGESTSVSWRVGQHLKSNSRLMESLRAAEMVDPVAHAAMAFEVQAIPVSIGRLELEEMEDRMSPTDIQPDAPGLDVGMSLRRC
jgi:excinuclease UvrABC nuclease subunit